jgi:hypothetical protein
MSDRKSARRDAHKPARPAAAMPSRPFTLTAGWAAVVLGLLTVFFFHALVFEGKTFVSPDAMNPVGFVRVGEQSLYHDHVYPLWNPYVFLGMPSFASGTYNPLIYPPDWPLALVNKVIPLPDMTWMLLYYFLGGLFLFLLARELGARPEGALLAAAAFVFAPNLVAVGSHGHGSQLVDSAYLPLMLWLAVRWMRRGGIHHLAWLALAGGFQLLRAHVQICFYTWLAVGLYVAVEWLAALPRRRTELVPLTLRALGIGVAAGLAFGLAGFYNLPLSDYARYSIRGGSAGGGVGMGYATAWSLAPYELPSVLVPGWVGFGGPTYWGGMPFTDYPNAYLGVVAVLLAVPAFLGNGSARLFALLLAALSLLISFGHYFPLYGFLYSHMPLFNKFRVPVMVILLFQLAVALGTAWGWSAILPGGDPKAAEPRVRARRVGNLLIALAVLLALALVAGVMGQGLWREAYVHMAMAHKGGGAMTLGGAAGAQTYTPEDAALAWQGFVSGLGRACLIGLLALGVAWFARRGRLPAVVATSAVLVLLLFELWPVSTRVMEPTIGDVSRRIAFGGRDGVIEFLEKAGPPGTFRIITPDDPLATRYAGYGIASLGGMHAAKPRLFQDFADMSMQTSLDFMRLLNIRYLLVERRLPSPPPFVRLVYDDGSNFIYDNLSALPRATLVDRYQVVRPARAILDSIRFGTHDMAEFAFLEQDPGVALGPVAGGRAQVTSYRLNDVTVEVESPGPALLRLADLWYPDWTARVDGRPTPILKSDYLLRAVPVPAGRHRVEFRFESPAMRRGLTVSLLSLLVVLAGFAWSWWAARRTVPAAPLARHSDGVA